MKRKRAAGGETEKKTGEKEAGEQEDGEKESGKQELEPHVVGMFGTIRDGLSKTKRLHGALKEAPTRFSTMSEEWKSEVKALKKLALEANRTFAKLHRLVEVGAIVRQTELAIQREEMKEELVDREANASRIVDRVRLFTERSANQELVYQRSISAAAQIADSVKTLCSWTGRMSASVEMIDGLRTLEGRE